MGVLNTPNQQPPGLAGVKPGFIYLETDNTVAEVTTTGFLTQSLNLGWQFNDQQLAAVETTDSGVILARVSISPGNVVSLTVISISGNSVISAGSNGVAGEVDIWPATTNKGHRKLVAANNAANYVITETNASFGQDTTITTPDAGAASAANVIATGSLVSGNLPVWSGTAGKAIDSGIVATNVQLKTQVKAQQLSWVGGTASHGFTVSGVTTSSVAVASVVSAVNATESILAVVCTTNTVTITFTGDPGAVVVNIIAYIAAQ